MNYGKTLIPLDGSPLAEKVLPYIPHLLSPDTSELLLVSNVDGTVGDMQTYLAQISARLPAFSIETQLVHGRTAESIVTAATDANVDLIVMSTHGRTGLGRATLGSVADRVLHLTATPVFLTQSKAIERPGIQRILVPLDGSLLSEQVLPHVQGIARHTGASIVLLLVLEQYTTWQWGELVDGRPLFHTAEADVVAGVERYLNQIKQTFFDVDCRVTCDVKLAPGLAGQAILAAAAEEHCDLIAMSTHGRSGYKRWRYGSVADKVLHESTLPLLLVCGEETQGEET